MVSLSMVIRSNGDTRSNRENIHPFSRESRTSSTRRTKRKSWPRDGVEILDVYRNPDVALCRGDGDHGAGVRRGRVLTKACGHVLVE